MAKVYMNKDNLHIKIQGLRKFFSFKRQIIIPWEHVLKVKVNPNVFKNPPKVLEKRLGTNLFGVYMGGWFKQNGKKVFWDVRHPESAIVIHLKNERFKYLVIDVKNAKKTVKEIKKYIKAR